MSEIYNINKPYIPTSDEGYTDKIKVEVDGKLKALSLQIPKKPDINFQSEMWDILNNFENECWSEKRSGLDTGFQSLNKAFDGGIKPGFIIIGGDSNVGKTIMLSQLVYQIANNNEHVYVMDFSLDDPMDDKIPRVVASHSRVPINIIKNPSKFTDNPMVLARRLKGINDLRLSISKYRIYDATFTSNIEDIEEEIKRVKIELDSVGRGDDQIVVAIDNFHDLTSNKKIKNEEKYDYLAQYCADLAIRHNLVLICSGELRKPNGQMRPTADSIRESVKIKYEAKAILLCHNDVHYRGEGAEVFFQRTDKEGKQPVLEIHFAKNKMSSFKGRLFFEQYPEMSRLEEADEESVKRYSSTIYS